MQQNGQSSATNEATKYQTWHSSAPRTASMWSTSAQATANGVGTQQSRTLGAGTDTMGRSQSSKINDENAQFIDRQMKNLLRKRQLLLIYLVSQIKIN
jgi:hypothetical protein